MEYILIDENNIILEMYNTDDIEKIKKQEEYKSTYRIELKKDYHFKGLNLNRVVDDVVLSNKEAIEKGLIILKDNEVLINDNILVLDRNKKVVNNEIVEKTLEEKLNDGLITQEQYNEIQNEKREQEYKNKTDNLELTRSFLNRNINNLTEEEKVVLDEINNEVVNIKQEYPKQN